MTKYDPSQPDGFNESLDSAISADGTPHPTKRYTIPARCGVAARLNTGQKLTICNPSGWQVCDFWAFNAEDMHEFMSMEHIHTDLLSVSPKGGDRLVSNLRNPILTFTHDSSSGIHDTLVACCDSHRYQQLGHAGYHHNCADNLRQALLAIGQKAPLVPAPFNIWMNVPIRSGEGLEWAPPVSKPGDTVTFRAEIPVLTVMSACPQDITPVNGNENAPTSLEFFVDDE